MHVDAGRTLGLVRRMALDGNVRFAIGPLGGDVREPLARTRCVVRRAAAR